MHKSNGAPLFEVKDLRKTYRVGEVTVEALRGINLEVLEGRFVVILGPSGSGKSTLLNIIGGIDTPTAGRVFFRGEDLSGYSERLLTRYRRNHVGFVFQFYNLIPTLAAGENVELGMEYTMKGRGEIRRKSARYLEMVGLGDKMNSYPQELSGGEQQRVAIARALAKEPAMILADEPTGNVDEEREGSIMGIMQNLKEELKMTFLIVSHNSRLSRFMDRVVYLRHGKLHDGRG